MAIPPDNGESEACIAFTAPQEADVVMATFDQTQGKDLEFMTHCTQHNTGVLLKKIFNSGHLLTDNATRSTTQIIEQQMQLIFAQKAVNSAIIGTVNCQHLHNNVQCALLGLADNSRLV